MTLSGRVTADPSLSRTRSLRFHFCDKPTIRQLNQLLLENSRFIGRAAFHDPLFVLFQSFVRATEMDENEGAEFLRWILLHTVAYMRLRTRRSFLICFALCATAYAQIPLADERAIAGPWECRDANGIHGIFISTHTQLTRGAVGNAIARQNVSIRVYQRLNTGATHSGYFSVGHSDFGGSAVFDGKRLGIQLSRQLSPPHLPPFSLEAVLEPGSTRWSGNWSLCEPPGGTVLERPQPGPDVVISALAGNWERQPDPNRPHSVGESLHIRQSADGTKSAFQEILSDAHVIQELSFTSSPGNTVVLRRISSRPQRFKGTLSADGSMLSGRWIDEGGTGVYGVDNRGRLIIPTDIPAVYKRRP
jgi:hypothetical protein